MNDSTPVLQASDLHKRFGGVIAANAIDFSLAVGELRCVIGPNGAGKSTFFSLLCGIQRPDRGRIMFGGQDITNMEPFRRVRLGIGLTFQTNRAFHTMSVAENLETARLGGSSADMPYFEMAMQDFGLVDRLDLPASQLPHHELQWLEICMALRRGPRVLLLDEPTAGLSPAETSHTASVLKRLNRAGLSIVVVEHDVTFVRETAQTVTVLHQGAIFAEGTVAEIIAREDVRSIYLGRVRERVA
jgi:ABC-type uncharacterized transport system ATPase subunit